MATPVAHVFAERYRALRRFILAPRAIRSSVAKAGRVSWRYVAQPQSEPVPAHGVERCLAERLAGLDHEMLVCLFYDADGAFRAEQIGEGMASAVSAERSALTRAAIEHKARYVVIAHNHPRGEARPSAQDIEATRALYSMFAAIGMRLVDHAIVARDRRVFSFRQAGLI